MTALTHVSPLTAFGDEAVAANVPFGRATFRDASLDASLGAPLHDMPALSIHIYSDLAVIEAEWRSFERVADCTAFQTFDWLAAWQRHIGTREGARPVIAVGRFASGDIAFIMPLCVVPEFLTRRLCWLGQGLCDYNAPLLARDFADRVTPEQFLAAWREVKAQIRCEPLLRFHWIEFEKMPERIGTQVNPFIALDVTPNASSAHITHLSDNWETFYHVRRSSATRRRDRAKRRHMSEFGDIRFATANDAEEARRTLETLMEQKSRALVRKGIADMFARPGYREFYRDLATSRKTPGRFHVSRVDIGTATAAANFGIVFGDCYYHVLASYTDTEIAHYGPGGLHLRELMAHAIGRGLAQFDFTIGDEPYKLEWSDTVLKLYDYTAAVSWRGLPARRTSAERRRVKRVIKQTPLLWRLASQVRSAVGMLTRGSTAAPADGTPVVASAAPPARTATACVMGDMDLLRPLAMAGIPCAVVGRPGTPSLYSRHAQSRLVWDDYATDTDRLIDALTAFGKAQAEPPVLFYEEDAQTLLISRQRDRLARAFRFAIADAALIEDLLDKSRFQTLAERHDLPVPAARLFNPAATEPGDLGMRLPLVIKPLTRLERWNDAFGLRKALGVENTQALESLWPQLRATGLELLAQEFVAGAESRIESYHCYIDRGGGLVAEFTGRKLRTYPTSFGHTTALEITNTDDVRRQGRAAIEKLALTGVAKLDFKRDPQGNLHLLEINPRFTLWHHAAAVAGVNIPALVYADLTGEQRPQAARVKTGARWCRAWKDFPAARSTGVPLTQWLPWALGSEAKSSLSWDDPLPFVGSALHRLTGRHDKPAQTGTWRGRYRGRT